MPSPDCSAALSLPAVADISDVIDRLAVIAPGSRLAELRARRPDVVRYTQSSYRVLLEPGDPVGVSRRERELVALRVAARTPSPAVVAWHRERLGALRVDAETVAAVERGVEIGTLSPRERAILDHADRLTLAPGTATREHVSALRAAGLSQRDVVTVSQLIAFVSYQVRVLVTLAALGGAASGPGAPNGGAAVATGRQHTMAVLDWRPWLETVDEVDASPEQRALVDEVTPTPTGRAYYALLAHDAPALRERTALFNAIMYGPGGARRSDRELASIAVSLVNGCVYCASVHARRFAQLTRSAEVAERLLAEGVGTALGPRERAVVDLAVSLTRDPARLGPADLAPLRAAGLPDDEILDVANAAAMFAWANRLMQTLGEPAPAPSTSG